MFSVDTVPENSFADGFGGKAEIFGGDFAGGGNAEGVQVDELDSRMVEHADAAMRCGFDEVNGGGETGEEVLPVFGICFRQEFEAGDADDADVFIILLFQQGGGLHGGVHFGAGGGEDNIRVVVFPGLIEAVAAVEELGVEVFPV